MFVTLVLASLFLRDSYPTLLSTIVFVIVWAVAWIDFNIPMRNGKPVLCRVVNGYCPTNTKSENNPRLVQDFYRKLSSAISVPSRYELFVACDFNGRLGMLDQADYDNGVSDYVGRHGMGKRNHNGHYLL